MLATIQQNTNLARRAIELVAEIEQREDYIVRLVMRISHQDKGRYLVTVWRDKLSNGFATVSIHNDRAYGEYETRGARYSAKTLQAIAEDRMKQFESEIIELAEWAREIK